MASLPLQFEVSNCNLGPINGLYKFSKQNCYMHANGKYMLVKGTDNIWTITNTNVNKERHCFAQKSSKSPCDVAWNYHSKAKSQIHASSMVVSKSGQTAKAATVGKVEASHTPIVSTITDSGPASNTRRKTASPVPADTSRAAKDSHIVPHEPVGNGRKNIKGRNVATVKAPSSSSSPGKSIDYTTNVPVSAAASNPEPDPVVHIVNPERDHKIVFKSPHPIVEPTVLPEPMSLLLHHPSPPPPPLPPIPEEPKEHNICRYSCESLNNTPFTVYAPIKCTAAAQKPHEETMYHGQWAEIEPIWASTVANFEDELRLSRAAIEHLAAEQRDFATQRLGYTNTINDLSVNLAKTTERLKETEQRADCLISRAGKSHIKRDWQQTTVESEFPTGEDIRAEFMAQLLNFESFAEDCVNCLEDLGHEDDAKDVLVRDVVVPFFTVLSDYLQDKLRAHRVALFTLFGVEVNEDSVEDTVPKLFWYSTQQLQIPPQIAAMTDEEIAGLLEKAGPKVTELHQQMLTAEKQNMISSGEGTLRYPQLARILLRMLTIAELSDPRCFLLPTPGVTITFKEGFTQEVLSPGVKKHGRIKEGDTVEVVLPGLYFENPHGDFANVKPTMPCLVRRLMPKA